MALPAMVALSAISLRAEVLARRGLAGWDGTLEAPAGERAALSAARRAAPWRADLLVALGLSRDLPEGLRERCLIDAIHTTPSYALAYLALGALRAQRGDQAGALILYRAAEALDRAGSATPMRLAALYIDMMRLDEALPRLARAVRIAPEQRLAEALSLAATLTTDPATLDAIVPPEPGQRLAAARLLQGLGLLSAADVEYEKASAAEPANVPIFDSHVAFHLGRQERGDAIRLIRARLGHGGAGDMPLRLQLAQLLIDTGRIEESAAELQEASRLNPPAIELTNMQAILELARGRVDRAVEIAQGLVNRRPEAPAARVTLARALWGRGDRTGAARELARAEALDRSRPEVQLLLGRLNRELGNEAEAARRYRRAIEMGYVSPAREELATLPAGARAGAGG
jgi:tetratricopeptide (TPR) repeat protein